RAEISLHEKSSYLSTLLEACPIAIVAENADGKIELSNPAFRELFGYSHEEMQGKSMDDLVAFEEDRKRATELTKEVLAGNVVHAVAVRRHKSGMPIDVEAFGVPFVMDGVLRGQFGIYQDIGERLRAQGALRESEEMFRTLTAAAPIGIFRTDREGNVIYLNEKWRSMTGLAAAEGQGQGWQRALHPEDRERVVKAWSAASSRGEEFRESYRYLNQNGSPVW